MAASLQQSSRPPPTDAGSWWVGPWGSIIGGAWYVLTCAPTVGVQDKRLGGEEEDDLMD